jgi:hypothetical protein
VRRTLLRRPEVLVVAVLTAIWLPGTIASDLRGLRDDRRLQHPADARGPAAAAGTDLALIHAARARIPKADDFAIVAGGRWHGRRLAGGLQLAREAGASWTQYALAPRFQVAPGRARWLLVLDTTPAAAGLQPRKVWRFGSDWLVQR